MLTVMSQKTKHVELRASATVDLQPFSNRLPSIGHAGRQGEARLVAVIQIEFALQEAATDFLQFTLRAQIFFRLVYCAATFASASNESWPVMPAVSVLKH